MYVKNLKRKCGVRGCKNTDTYAVSHTRESGNSIIICKECAEKIVEAIEKYERERPVSEKKSRPAPPLFYKNVAAQKPGKNTPQAPDGVGSTARTKNADGTESTPARRSRKAAVHEKNV